MQLPAACGRPGLRRTTWAGPSNLKTPYGDPAARLLGFYLGAQVAGLGISILQVVDNPTAKDGCAGWASTAIKKKRTRMHPHENYENKGL